MIGHKKIMKYYPSENIKISKVVHNMNSETGMQKSELGSRKWPFSATVVLH